MSAHVVTRTPTLVGVDVRVAGPPVEARVGGARLEAELAVAACNDDQGRTYEMCGPWATFSAEQLKLESLT